MEQYKERTDLETAAKVNEALGIQHAFGNDVARRFLKLRNVDPDVTERVLTAPRDARRET